MIWAGILAIEVSDHVETDVVGQFSQDSSVFFEIGFLLGDGDDVDVAFFQFVVILVQLNQLPDAEGSPERSIGRDDNVFSLEIRQVDFGTVGTREGEVGGLVTDLKKPEVAAP